MNTKKFNIEGIAPYFSVFDMPVSLKFYRDVVGFEIVESSGPGDDVDWVMLKINGAILMLNTAYNKAKRPPFANPVRIAAHGDVTLYFSTPFIDDLYTHFIQNGVELGKPAITVYGWTAIRVKDPDGYELCFHWPVEKQE